MKTIIIVVGIFMFNNANAVTMVKCGRTFVDKGDSLSELYKSCGKPDFKHESSGGASKNKRSSWHYGKKTFHIYKGRISKIEVD